MLDRSYKADEKQALRFSSNKQNQDELSLQCNNAIDDDPKIVCQPQKKKSRPSEDIPVNAVVEAVGPGLFVASRAR
jgi:hypothetical protein